ncbi:hypothetical protein [Nocardia asteroides]|uniref:hypothetical protein n=1 Tax=Nocardia asteroides TaxID=1824 RepID=UPI001E395829|nr:hypothetical protein [Nocardia asteroides]UGT63934.1 hypothetical protein LTT61_11780 [Nocardia asteroides]
MGTGKHRALAPARRRMGYAVAAGAVPVALSLVATGTAHASPEPRAAVGPVEVAPIADEQAPAAAEVPNVNPYYGVRYPDEVLSSLQGARSMPAYGYLSPVENLHGPAPAKPVPPITPPAGVLRFGDVQVESPDWLPREQAIQINDAAAAQEAGLATYFDSVGMERTRSDRVASQTIGSAAAGAAAGAAFAAPFGVIGAAAGGTIGALVGVPFMPIGLAAVPLGAAYGAGLMVAPLAAIGAGLGAGVGVVQGLAAPPQALGPAPEVVQS